MTSIFPVKTDDLGGKLVIKVQLGDDLRRILIHNEELTLDELVLMLQRVFKPQLDNLESFIIKYKDEDDEYITIAEEFDLSYAIHTYKTLRLKIILPHTCESSVECIKPGAPVNSSTDTGAIASQINRLHEDVKQLVEKFGEFLDYKVESKSCPHESAKLTSTTEAPSNTLSDNEPPKINSSTPKSLDSVVSPSVPHKPVESAPSSHPISTNQPSTLDSFMPSSLSGSLSGQHSMPPMASAASTQPPILPTATSLISSSPAPQNPPVSAPQPPQPALLPTSYLSQQSGGPSSIIGQGPPPRFLGGPMPPPQQQFGGMAQPPLTHQSRPISAASNASPHLMGGQVQGPPPPPMPPSIPMISQPSQLSMGGISSNNMMPPPPAMSMSGMNSGMISPPPPMGAGVNRFPPAAPSPGSGMIPPPPPMGGMGPRPPPQLQMPLQLGGPPMYGGPYDQRPM
nr:protein TFG [Hymenolepis microstoma]